VVNGIETSMKKESIWCSIFWGFHSSVKYLVFRDLTLHFWEAFGSSVQEPVTVMLCHILEDQNQNIKYLKS